MPSVNTYDLFAKFYDKLDYNEFSIQAVYYLNDILASLNFNGLKILDVACGTGTSSLWFSEQGYQVTAIDSSSEMIQLARKKARLLKLDITFQNVDMRILPYTHQFDLAVCLFDSLNHLLKYSDLQKALMSISRSLQSQGYLIFDMITPYELSSRWHNTARQDTKDNVSLLLNSKYDKKSRKAIIQGKFFIKDKNRIRQFTRHFQNKAYTKTEIKQALRESGFRLLHEYDCFTFDKPKPRTHRIFYVTQKEN